MDAEPSIVTIRRLLFAGLVLAACGSSAPKVLSGSAARHTAERSVLALDDLGPGWTIAPQSSGSPAGGLALGPCISGIDLDKDAQVSSKAVMFAHGSEPSRFAAVAVRTGIFSSTTVKEVFADLRGPGFKACVAKVVATADLGGNVVHVDKMTIDPKLTAAHAQYGAQIVLPFTSQLRTSTSSNSSSSQSTTPVDGTYTFDFIGDGQVVSVLVGVEIGHDLRARDLNRWAAIVAARHKH